MASARTENGFSSRLSASVTRLNDGSWIGTGSNDESSNVVGARDPDSAAPVSEYKKDSARRKARMASSDGELNELSPWRAYQGRTAASSGKSATHGTHEDPLWSITARRLLGLKPVATSRSE